MEATCKAVILRIVPSPLSKHLSDFEICLQLERRMKCYIIKNARSNFNKRGIRDNLFNRKKKQIYIDQECQEKLEQFTAFSFEI